MMDQRSIRWGVLASTGMAAFYAGVVAWANGWSHLTSQVGQDWYFLVPIIVGFGVQVALMMELRHRNRMRMAEAATGSASTGASTVGMLACCAHHLTAVLPLVGATGAAAFLANYRVAFMVTGIALNAVGITVAARRLRQVSAHHRIQASSCATV